MKKLLLAGIAALMGLSVQASVGIEEAAMVVEFLKGSNPELIDSEASEAEVIFDTIKRAIRCQQKNASMDDKEMACCETLARAMCGTLASPDYKERYTRGLAYINLENAMLDILEVQDDNIRAKAEAKNRAYLDKVALAKSQFDC